MAERPVHDDTPRSRSRSRSPNSYSKSRKRSREERNRSLSRSRSRLTSTERKKKKKSKEKKHKKSKRKENDVSKSKEEVEPPQLPKLNPKRDFFAQLKQQESTKEMIGTIHTSGRKHESSTAINDNWECIKAGCGNSNMKRATSCIKCGAMRRISQWR